MSRLLTAPPVILLESHSLARDPESWAFSRCQGQVAAWAPSEVRPALAEVEKQARAGSHAVGFLSYEAASGLDPALVTRAGCELPLAWFGIYQERTLSAPAPQRPAGTYTLGAWQASIDWPAYREAFESLREHLAAGDTYQVNFTFRQRAAFSGDQRPLYWELCRAQRASYCAYLDLGRHCLLSASPELFFSLRGGVLTARPMKGTRPRGRSAAEDQALAEELRASPKERAENVMIVDLLRNDLGRVSTLGTVQAVRLWEVEQYETVQQLTSTVQSRVREGVGLVELLAALFPCGSVTGAPKVRTMQLIAEYEDAPRGIYTGCIGFVSPGPEIRFNVAIRTAWVDRERGRIEFGVGGGITWDSSPEAEYAECEVKARVLRAAGRQPAG